jgi:hypothetical protein
VYSYFYVLSGRRSFQNKLRSHIYPTSVAELPWNDAIAANAGELEHIKTDLLQACERRYEQVVRLKAESTTLGLQPLRDVVRAVKGASIARSEALLSTSKFMLVVGEVDEQEEDLWRLSLDESGDCFIQFNNRELAEFAREGLLLSQGSDASWTFVLSTPIPSDCNMAERLRGLRASFDPEALDDAIEDEITKIDDIVGNALGLNAADIAEIQRDMTEDAFLSRVRPRYPFFRPRQYGRRLNLEREGRYRAG